MTAAATGLPTVFEVPPPSPYDTGVRVVAVVDGSRGRSSPEAVARRRANRAAASAFRRGLSVRRAAVPAAPAQPTQHRQEVARRMAVRFHRGGPTIDMMALDYRYWQARRCGWDVRAKEWRTVGHDRAGRPVLCEPSETVIWRWWTDLHYTQRDALVAASTFLLVRDSKATERRVQTAA